VTGTHAQVWAIPADDAPGRWRLILGTHRGARYTEKVLRGGRAFTAHDALRGMRAMRSLLDAARLISEGARRG
jgi:hypothetical protein